MKEKITKKTDSTGIRPRPVEPDSIEPRRTGLFPSDLFFRFRYSAQSVTEEDGRARIRATETRFENGKLESETFEGELSIEHYLHSLQEMQRLLADRLRSQLNAFVPFFSSFFSLPGKKTKTDE